MNHINNYQSWCYLPALGGRVWYSKCIYKYSCRNGDKGKVAQRKSQLR